MNKIKFPKKLGQKELENFFKKKGLTEIIRLSKSPEMKVNEMIISNPYKPELEDLYRLYQFIILNKRTTILEFGSGWSSLIFSLALKELKNKYNNQIKKYLIIGHTDTMGTKKYNYKLSLERAVAVRNILIENNINEEDIEILAKGEDDLLIKTADQTKYPANRRAEITLIN